jgi:hypothetical protein
MSSMAAALPDTRADPCAVLPHALALRLFSALSLEERLRYRRVCRGWRATLDDHSLWLRLDLTRADGRASYTALLRAATARAGGQLQALRLTCITHPDHAAYAPLLSVAAANGATLQELRVQLDAPLSHVHIAVVRALLLAAPNLRILEADVSSFSTDEALRLLRNEPPFEPLRVRRITITPSHDDYNYGRAATLALAADVAAHVWLTGLRLYRANLEDPVALDALVDAAHMCTYSPYETI